MTGHRPPRSRCSSSELREYAEHRGLIIICEYVNRMSGSKDSRPAQTKCIPPDTQSARFPMPHYSFALMNCSNAASTIASGVVPSCATTGSFTQIVLPADKIGPFMNMQYGLIRPINS